MKISKITLDSIENMVILKNRVQVKLEISWGIIVDFNTSKTIPK